jgi:tetratricopeptide (TPR) repeat protein
MWMTSRCSTIPVVNIKNLVHFLPDRNRLPSMLLAFSVLFLTQAASAEQQSDVAMIVPAVAPRVGPNMEPTAAPTTAPTATPAEAATAAPTYLDDQQAQLAKNCSCDLDTYFEFCPEAGPNSGVSPETRFIPWTEDDKKKLCAVLERILKTVPGLVISAGSTDKVRLFKATNLQVMKYGHEKNFADVPGVSLISGIALSEHFFKRNDQYEFLLHELTHRADFGGHICYSKAWCDFAVPHIARYHLQNQMLTERESWHFDHRLRSKNRWPSLYGTENVQEAFAEYMTALICPQGFTVDPSFKEKFANRLLVPSDADLLWAHHVRKGTLEYQRKNLDVAIAELQEATKIDANNPYVHDYLALCYAAKDDTTNGLPESQQTIDLFDAAGVPRWDSTRISAELVQIGLLRSAHQYADEKQKLDEILIQLPNDSESYRKRAHCLERSGQLSAAASDLYNANRQSVWRKAFNPFASDVDTAMKERLIDRFVMSQPRSDWALRIRSRYKELLADKEVDPGKKNDLYVSALQDMENSLGSNDCSEVSGLVDCAQIRLKLEDVDGAKRDILSALALNPDAIDAHIFCIRLQELAGETELAQKEFEHVKEMIYAPLVGTASGMFQASSLVLPWPKDPALELQYFLNGNGRRLTGIDDIGRCDRSKFAEIRIDD